MRLIDADAVVEAVKDEIAEAHAIEAAPDFIAGLKLGLAYVNTAPTVDAVPVVRCKDCKHFEGERKYCGYDRFVPNDLCFCFSGEVGKKEEDNEAD